MNEYPYGKIKILAEQLNQAGVDPEVIDQIMVGGENIRQTSDNAEKSGWMRGAMQRMDKLLNRDTRREVREACACCLGGQRFKLSKAIAKNHATLEQRIRAANETKMVFGHSVTLQEDGTILVAFAPEGLPQYRCSCLGRVNAPISITYCYCCGGHVKHHLQTALGKKLEVKVCSSALSSGGTRPCTFLFKILENEKDPASR